MSSFWRHTCMTAHMCMHCFCRERDKHCLQCTLLCPLGNCSICFSWELVTCERCELYVCERSLACKVDGNPSSTVSVTALLSIWLEFQMCDFFNFFFFFQHPVLCIHQRGFPSFPTYCSHETGPTIWLLSSLGRGGTADGKLRLTSC